MRDPETGSEASRAADVLQAIELFAGAGGLALGLKRAGFDAKLLVDSDRESIRTLQANRSRLTNGDGPPKILCSDVRQLDYATYDGVDLVSAGAPCQPFSQLVAKLKIEKAHDDVRLVTLNGVVLGRLGQNADSGYWELDWRMGWKRLSSQHAGSGEGEHAETWAVEEIANLMAVERSAIDAGGPWGRSPPPGVT